MDITIKQLETHELSLLTSAFASSVWDTAEAHFQRYLAEQDRGERVFLIAYSDSEIAGYVTIKWQSGYPPFAEKAIPEINDLRVLPQFRRRGIATALVDEAEKRVSERSRIVGIGVGMYADYGPAQRMYVLRGYVPDGLGLYHGKQPVISGQTVPVDDDLVLYLTRELRSGV